MVLSSIRLARKAISRACIRRPSMRLSIMAERMENRENAPLMSTTSKMTHMNSASRRSNMV